MDFYQSTALGCPIVQATEHDRQEADRFQQACRFGAWKIPHRPEHALAAKVQTAVTRVVPSPVVQALNSQVEQGVKPPVA